MATTKTCLMVGPTGAGKSKQVGRYSNGAPIVGHNLSSETSETKGYDASIAGEHIKFYDTPGLGDSEQRDQIFLDNLVRVLQDNCYGVHKFYFAISIYETRFGAHLSDCLDLLISLAPDIKEKPCILTIMLTMADRGGEAFWGQNLEQKVAQYKEIVRERAGSAANVIVVGEGNQDQFINDIRNTSINVYAQTKFMKNVETLATQKAKAEEALQKARDDNEQNVEKINALESTVATATENYNKKCEETRRTIEDMTKKVNEANERASRARKRGFLRRVAEFILDIV